MTFNNLFRLVCETAISRPHLVIIEDNPGLQALMRQSFIKRWGIQPDSIYIFDTATEAILYIGSHYSEITHYSLDFDLAQGEKGLHVAEFLQKEGNDGHNVWIHSGNQDRREEFLNVLPHAHIVPSPLNIDSIGQSLSNSLSA